MEKYFKVILILLLVVGTGQISIVNAQRYLLIETYNDPETIKLAEGDEIEFKISDSDEWQKLKIAKLMVKDSTVLFAEGFYHIRDITHIKRYRPAVNYVGKGLMTFGSAWLVFGGLGAASGNYKLGADTFVIGGGSIVLGWAFRKAFYKRKLAMGKRYRLRMVDVSLQ